MTERAIVKGSLNDPDCEGNSAKYHTGKPCIEPGCDKPAGTHWGPYWCFQHNVERNDRIDRNLKGMVADMAAEKKRADEDG